MPTGMFVGLLGLILTVTVACSDVVGKSDLQDSIDSLETRVASLPTPTTPPTQPPVDLSPLQTQIAELDARLTAIAEEPAATGPTLPLAVATPLVSAACLEAILTVLAEHQHEYLESDEMVGEPIYASALSALFDSALFDSRSKRQLTSLLARCN